MKPVTVYSANNDQGEELFGIIHRLCTLLNLKVNRPTHSESRKEYIRVFRKSSLVILDRSIDKEGGTYLSDLE